MPQDIQRANIPDLRPALFKVPSSAQQSPILVEDFPAMTPQTHKGKISARWTQQSLKARKQQNLTLIEVSRACH